MKYRTGAFCTFFVHFHTSNHWLVISRLSVTLFSRIFTGEETIENMGCDSTEHRGQSLEQWPWLAFLLKPWVRQAFFKLPSHPNHASHPFPPAKLGKRTIRAMLWSLDLCGLYYLRPCTLCLPHKWKELYYRSLCTLCLPHKWKDGKRERSSI
jgi:hypothetical protein